MKREEEYFTAQDVTLVYFLLVQNMIVALVGLAFGILLKTQLKLKLILN